MNLMRGYLWKTTGEWELADRDGRVYAQFYDPDAQILVCHEDGDGGAYVLTANPDIPGIAWGTVREHVPDKTRTGQPLDVLDYDEYAGYTVWIAQADGRTNGVTVLAF